MPKRSDLIKLLKAHGYVSLGGSKHEKFKNGSSTTFVPRHKEISSALYREILKQIGLR